jgi:hypothetical protein
MAAKVKDANGQADVVASRPGLLWYRIGMIGDPLNIESDGTSIVVTMPGTDFSVTY